MTLAELHDRTRSWMPFITAAITLAALAWVAHVLASYSPGEIWAAIGKLDMRAIAWASALSAGSYLSLGLFDYLGIRYAGRELPYPRVAFASFVALAIGHTVGLAPFSSGTVRYRFYSRWGLRNREIGLVVLFCAVTVGIGEIAVSALVLMLEPDIAAHVLTADPVWLRVGGIACTLVLASYVVLCAIRRDVRVWKWRLALPSWRVAIAQILVGLVNYALVIGTLQACLVAEVKIGYVTTSIAFVLANLAALVTAVPGGLGVIEAVILALVPGSQSAAGILAFRVLYFLVPFAIGLALLAVVELRLRTRRRAPAQR